VTSSSQTDPLVEEAPFQNTQKSGKNENMVVGPETKNGCAGEGQQLFTGLGWELSEVQLYR
jgi:hypothetical protein